MCYKCVLISDRVNLLQPARVPSVHTLHHSASHIATVDLTNIFNAEVYNIYFLPLYVYLLILGFVIKQTKNEF